MRKILVNLLLVMSLSVPIFAQAQDVTEVPPPTFEVFETPTALPTETATPEPTATPAPTEEPVPPPPVDQTKVFESIFTVVMVLIVGAVTLGLAVIVVLFRTFAAPVRAILLSAIKTGVDEAGKFANTTETPIDDLAVAELRKVIAKLEAELNEVKAQVNQNSSDIVTTNRAVSQAISNR